MDQQLDLIMGAKKSLEATLMAERKHRQDLEQKLQELQNRPVKSTSQTQSAEDRQKKTEEKLDAQLKYLSQLILAEQDKI